MVFLVQSVGEAARLGRREEDRPGLIGVRAHPPSQSFGVATLEPLAPTGGNGLSGRASSSRTAVISCNTLRRFEYPPPAPCCAG